MTDASIESLRLFNSTLTENLTSLHPYFQELRPVQSFDERMGVREGRVPPPSAQRSTLSLQPMTQIQRLPSQHSFSVLPPLPPNVSGASETATPIRAPSPAARALATLEGRRNRAVVVEPSAASMRAVSPAPKQLFTKIKLAATPQSSSNHRWYFAVMRINIAS
jgi:hypothetical protein